MPDSWTISPDRPRVGLLVDYPILLRGVRAVQPDAVPRLDAIVKRAGELGPLHVARAYGAWYEAEEAQVAFTSGLDPVFVPPVGPGTAPTATALVADGLALLRSGQVEALVLSGDDRLLPLAAAAHAAGVPLALVAHGGVPNGPCTQFAAAQEPVAAYVRELTRAERYRRPSFPVTRTA